MTPLSDGRNSAPIERGRTQGREGRCYARHRKLAQRRRSYPHHRPRRLAAVKVYYDVANSTERADDIDKEIRWLGKQGQIASFMKENGKLLGQGRIDFRKVRAALDDIGYRGPMQIEAAVPTGANLIESYIANRKFLQDIFPPDA